MVMNRISPRWLESRQPEQRTGNEAEKFSDDCCENGLL